MGGTFGEPTWLQTATVGKVEALGGGGGGGEVTTRVAKWRKEDDRFWRI